MLPDQATQLLTAFVDRELSQRQRKAVMRLLHKSSEAREMLRHLQENAHKLKLLPRRKIEPSLVDEILQAIAEQQAQPKQPAVKAARRRWLPYVVASMAAALLIGALGIVYWKTMAEPGGTKDANLAKHISPAPPSPKVPKAHPLLAPSVEGTFLEFSKQVPVDQVFSANFSELQDGRKSWQFAREVNREKAIQFDITVKSNVSAMVLLAPALRDTCRGITIVKDNSADNVLDDKKAQYLVYAENLTSDEVTKLMGELGRSYVDSKNKNNQLKKPSPYEKMSITPIANDDKQKLAKLLGKPADEKPAPKGEGKAAVMLPANGGETPSAEILKFAKQRGAPQAGTRQILIRIHQ
jgi:hypothetical protein